MIDREKSAILKDMEHYFGYLYERGFKIRAIEYSPQFNANWMAKLESSKYAIYITSDRNHILLECSPLPDNDVRKRISIEKLIYILSEGRDIIAPFKGNLAWGRKKQLERFSKLLNKYIEQITTYFDNRQN